MSALWALCGRDVRGPSNGTSRKHSNQHVVVKTRRRHGWPKLIAAFLVCGLIVVGVLWLGFSANYSVTRDVYFAVAIAHVLAEAPFLLRMI